MCGRSPSLHRSAKLSSRFPTTPALRAPAMPSRQYWLVKSEPDVFSFDDLTKAPKKTTHWNGVRNFAARNHLRSMKKGDLVFFYHSMAKPAAVVGIAEVVREAYPDPGAFDPKDEYYDPKSKKEDPTWFMVDIKAV